MGNISLGGENKVYRLYEIPQNMALSPSASPRHCWRAPIWERYAVGNLAKDCGILENYDMTVEAAVMKLMWILAHTRNQSEVKQAFYTVGDHDILCPNVQCTRRITYAGHYYRALSSIIEYYYNK